MRLLVMKSRALECVFLHNIRCLRLLLRASTESRACINNGFHVLLHGFMLILGLLQLSRPKKRDPVKAFVKLISSREECKRLKTNKTLFVRTFM